MRLRPARFSTPAGSGEHEYALVVTLAALSRLDAELILYARNVTPALHYPGDTAQRPDDGPSTITNSMSGCAHSAERQSPRSHSAYIDCTSSTSFDGITGLSRLRDTLRTMSEQSTTPDLVELARRNVEAGSSGDVDWLSSVYAPDAVWDASPVGMGIYAGQAEVRGFFEEWFGSYTEIEIEAEEIRDLGNGVTLSVVVQKGRLAGSTSFVQERSAIVCVWEAGLIARAVNYLDIDAARAAAERLAESRG
jgi:ketosteroid isomerase-like protein